MEALEVQMLNQYSIILKSYPMVDRFISAVNSFNFNTDVIGGRYMDAKEKQSIMAIGLSKRFRIRVYPNTKQDEEDFKKAISEFIA